MLVVDVAPHVKVEITYRDVAVVDVVLVVVGAAASVISTKKSARCIWRSYTQGHLEPCGDHRVAPGPTFCTLRGR